MKDLTIPPIDLDHLPVGLLTVSDSGHILSANAVCESLFGYTVKELQSLKFQQITHAQDLEKDIRLLSQTLEGLRDQYTLRKRYLKKDGAIFHAILNVKIVRPTSPDAKPYFVALVQDATNAFRNLEIAGLRSQRIHALTEYLDEMVWIATPKLDQILFLNSRFEEIWECSTLSAYQDQEVFLSRIHVDDRNRVSQALTKAGADRWEMTFQLCFNDGRTKYIRDHGQLVADDYGQPLYLIGSSTDITKEHEREIELRRLTRELAQANQALQQQVNHDVLTGALSRIGIIEVLTSALRTYRRYETVASLIFLDLNSFKLINDQFGHDAGDYVLMALVSEVKGLIRDSDHMGRYGGDEFIVFLPNTDKRGSETVAEKIRSMSLSLTYEGVKLPDVTVSVGLAEISRDDAYIDQWLKRADTTMYEHKAKLRSPILPQDERT